jgi:diguanylate cyclase (GGDEF)-like protein
MKPAPENSLLPALCHFVQELLMDGIVAKVTGPGVKYCLKRGPQIGEPILCLESCIRRLVMSKPLSLLVVEDDIVDVKAVQRMLGTSSTAYRTDNAQSLQQAKQKARRQHYDAVLLDLGLPDSQGIDGLIEFQASAPELPVVVLTGSQDQEMALHSMDMGAEDFLNKGSLSEEGLSRSLRFAIQRHRRRHEAYRDIDGLRISLDEAQRQADTDSLTGLPNRRGLQHYLEKRSRLLPGSAAVVGLADIDRFKAIKQAQGHLLGDMFLREFGGRLQRCLGRSDFAARIGGDEFVVIFGVARRAEAVLAGQCMLRQLSLHSRGERIPFTATLALAQVEDPSADLEQILHRSRTILARAKAAGGDRVECEWSFGVPGVTESSGEDLSVEKRMALHVLSVLTLREDPRASNYLHFDRAPEAWSLAQPMAERSQQVQRLTEMTLHCLRLAQQWRGSQAPGLQMHLDIEAEAMQPWVCAELARIFPSPQDRAGCIFFVPVNFFSKPLATSLAGLRLLRQAGFQIGVRDVGDGRTLLETLLALAPDWIRFDPALTAGVARQEKKAEALRQWMDVLRPLGAHMVAKSVEGYEDQKFLQDLGFAAYYGRE